MNLFRNDELRIKIQAFTQLEPFTDKVLNVSVMLSAYCKYKKEPYHVAVYNAEKFFNHESDNKVRNRFIEETKDMFTDADYFIDRFDEIFPSLIDKCDKSDFEY